MDGFYDCWAGFDYWAGYDQASRDIWRIGFDGAVSLLKSGVYSERPDGWPIGYIERLAEEKKGGEA